jgi:RES domain-containing protein
MIVYRLGSRRYPANEGEGAGLYGGRWNHRGTPVIYAAQSRALCALEILANADELLSDYIATPIELPNDLLTTSRSIATLPPMWNAREPSDLTRDIGTQWANSLMSAVLVVPSSVIPQELNYILNPRHPDFSKINFLTPEAFLFDDRLHRAWPKN